MDIPKSPEEIVAVPLRELALAILSLLVRAQQVNRTNFVHEVFATMSPPRGTFAGVRGRSANREPEAAQALGEAWDWLHVHGLLSPDPLQGPNFFFVTRRGQRVAADASLLDEDW